MYASFFGLSELPFNVTPDPRFLYVNGCYQEALAALSYGIDARKGFISVIGEAGTGKTTLLRRLLDTVGPSTRTALLLNPTVSFDEILEHILTELGIPSEGGRKLALLQRLNEFLIEHTLAGGNVALLIDEAQDLSIEVLEELRLLSNLETAREKILQIVLAGQPELEAKLADPRLRQLRQRVTLPIRLRTLAPDDVAAYVRTRLERAGGTDPNLFAPDALARIAVLTQGIPRLVNVLCDAALMAAFAADQRHVTATLVTEVWRDYADSAPPPAAPASPAPPPAADTTVAAEPESAPAPAEASAAAEPTAAVPSPPASVLDVPEPDEAQSATETRESAPDAASAPEPEAPAAATEPAPGAPAATPAAAAEHKTFSVPRAAALVIGLAGGLYLYLTFVQNQAAPPVGTPPPPAAVARSAAPPAAPALAALPVGEGPLSSADAAAVLDHFRAAVEARDVERVVALFADDAVENGRRGREAIGAGYRMRLGALDELRYRVTDPDIALDGERAGVRAPFVMHYRQPSGATGEVRGQAEWEIERREGRPAIVAFNYRLVPESNGNPAAH